MTYVYWNQNNGMYLDIRAQRTTERCRYRTEYVQVKSASARYRGPIPIRLADVGGGTGEKKKAAGFPPQPQGLVSAGVQRAIAHRS